MAQFIVYISAYVGWQFRLGRARDSSFTSSWASKFIALLLQWKRQNVYLHSSWALPLWYELFCKQPWKDRGSIYNFWPKFPIAEKPASGFSHLLRFTIYIGQEYIRLVVYYQNILVDIKLIDIWNHIDRLFSRIYC